MRLGKKKTIKLLQEDTAKSRDRLSEIAKAVENKWFGEDVCALCGEKIEYSRDDSVYYHKTNVSGNGYYCSPEQKTGANTLKGLIGTAQYTASSLLELSQEL